MEELTARVTELEEIVQQTTEETLKSFQQQTQNNQSTLNVLMALSERVSQAEKTNTELSQRLSAAETQIRFLETTSHMTLRAIDSATELTKNTMMMVLEQLQAIMAGGHLTPKTQNLFCSSSAKEATTSPFQFTSPTSSNSPQTCWGTCFESTKKQETGGELTKTN